MDVLSKFQQRGKRAFFCTKSEVGKIRQTNTKFQLTRDINPKKSAECIKERIMNKAQRAHTTRSIVCYPTKTSVGAQSSL
jgi:hypothetical protein